eukprot:6605913-Pyramimonas_sp.AAC.1
MATTSATPSRPWRATAGRRPAEGGRADAAPRRGKLNAEPRVTTGGFERVRPISGSSSYLIPPPSPPHPRPHPSSKSSSSSSSSLLQVLILPRPLLLSAALPSRPKSHPELIPNIILSSHASSLVAPPPTQRRSNLVIFVALALMIAFFLLPGAEHSATSAPSAAPNAQRP